MYLPRCPGTLLRALSVAVTALTAASSGVVAQTGDQIPTSPLYAGDSVRVNGALVGRVLSVEGSYFTLMSRGTPRCRAGEGHGDAPICDPAPLERTTHALDEVALERRSIKGNQFAYSLVGGLLGAAAFGTVGWFVGPEWGFGKIDGCTENDGVYCTDPVPIDEFDARQKSRDQKIGAAFFGVLGGTFGAIMARKLSVGWVAIRPTAPTLPEDGWGVLLEVPSN